MLLLLAAIFFRTRVVLLFTLLMRNSLFCCLSIPGVVIGVDWEVFVLILRIVLLVVLVERQKGGGRARLRRRQGVTVVRTETGASAPMIEGTVGVTLNVGHM